MGSHDHRVDLLPGLRERLDERIEALLGRAAGGHHADQQPVDRSEPCPQLRGRRVATGRGHAVAHQPEPPGRQTPARRERVADDLRRRRDLVQGAPADRVDRRLDLDLRVLARPGHRVDGQQPARHPCRRARPSADPAQVRPGPAAVVHVQDVGTLVAQRPHQPGEGAAQVPGSLHTGRAVVTVPADAPPAGARMRRLEKLEHVGLRGQDDDLVAGVAGPRHAGGEVALGPADPRGVGQTRDPHGTIEPFRCLG
jgi:hypothetical protein